MAWMAAITSGNYGTAATWATGSNTPSIHASTNITVSVDRFSATFTAPNTTNAAVGCIVFKVTNTAGVSFTCTLQEDIGGTGSWLDTTATATIAASNISNTWARFHFNTPYTYATTGANRYRYKLSPSASSTTVAADSGGSNFAFLALDSRASVPVTGDEIFVIGENAATAVTVTMNGTRTCGINTTTAAGVIPTNARTNAFGCGAIIAQGGILSWDTSANSTLTCKGHVLVDNNGEFRMGTVASPIPEAVTCQLIFDMAVDADHGFVCLNGGKATIQGAPKSSTSLWKSKYVSGDGTAASPLVVSTSVDWAVGDEIVIGPGTDSATSYNEARSGYILTKNSATSYVIAGSDLLTNGNMETAGAGGFDTLGSWVEVPGAATGNVTQTSVAAEVHSGTYAAKIERVSATTNIEQTITVLPSTAYELRFWVRADGSNIPRYRIQDVTSGAVDIVAITNVTNGSSTTYAEQSVQFTTPSGCTSVKIQLFCAAANGAIAYFDDVSVRQGTTLFFTRNTDSEVVNVTRNAVIKGTSQSLSSFVQFAAQNATGNVDIDWMRTENTANSATLWGFGVLNRVNCDYSVCYGFKRVGFSFSTNAVANTHTGLVATSSTNNSTSTTSGGLWFSTAKKKTLVDCIAINMSGAGFSIPSAFSNTFTRCKSIACMKGVSSTLGGIFLGTCGKITLVDCEAQACRFGGVTLSSATDILFTNPLIGTAAANPQGNITIITDTYNTVTFENAQLGPTTNVVNYTNLIEGSEVRFQRLEVTDNNHIWYTRFGTARSTGAGLADTTVRTTGSLGLRLSPEDATDGFVWEFNIPAKANSIVNFFGWFRKNTAFGTDDALVELFLPGSATADASYTLTDTTEAWQAVVLSASNTLDTDGLATIRVTAISATASAYLYVDDLYNAGDTVTSTDKVTGLDTWSAGKPIEIISPQATSAADIWTFPIEDLTTPGTTGLTLQQGSSKHIEL